MPYQYLDCNISHNRELLDASESTNQIEIKHLAQGHKHTRCGGAQTHNIDGVVIESPVLFLHADRPKFLLKTLYHFENRFEVMPHFYVPTSFSAKVCNAGVFSQKF